MNNMLSKTDCLRVIEVLAECYPDAKAELDYNSAFELLVAAILSAQCTDVRVNKVTEVLFREYNTPSAMLTLTTEELEGYIRTCGLYHAKAKNILAACAALMSDFHGEVPQTRDELMTLPGVGRKVANVVVSNAFSVPAIAVDTHVFRVANRIGLADAANVLDTERQLMANIPEDLWSISHHRIIFHGRRCCHAKKPACNACQVADLCIRKP